MKNNKIFLFNKQFVTKGNKISFDLLTIVILNITAFFISFLDKQNSFIILIVIFLFSTFNYYKIISSETFNYFKKIDDSWRKKIFLNLLYNCSPFIIYSFLSQKYTLIVITVLYFYLLPFLKFKLNIKFKKKIKIKYYYQINALEYLKIHSKRIFYGFFSLYLFKFGKPEIAFLVYILNFTLNINYKSLIFFINALEKEKMYIKNIYIGKVRYKFIAFIEDLTIFIIFSLLIYKENNYKTFMDPLLILFIFGINFIFDYYSGFNKNKNNSSFVELEKQKIISLNTIFKILIFFLGYALTNK